MTTDFMNIYGWPLLFILGHIGAIVGSILLVMAYYTYAERKVLGAMQRRQGPMTVGPFGLLQPIADGLKLLSKETIIPSQASRAVFLMSIRGITATRARNAPTSSCRAPPTRKRRACT